MKGGKVRGETERRVASQQVLEAFSADLKDLVQDGCGTLVTDEHVVLIKSAL